MKTYGYFCEDEAIEVFIDKTLEKIAPCKKCRGFKKHTSQLVVPNGRNSSMIKKQFVDAVKTAFKDAPEEERIDLFFISYDYDDTGIESFELHIHQQKDKIDIRSKGKCIFCIPVKCIEYWLWYIKHDRDEVPPLSNSIETDNAVKRADIKADIYGTASSVTKQLSISRPLLGELNIERLESLSPSFKNFTSQIREFCSRG